MQVLKQHKKIVLIAVLLVVILTVSLFIVKNASKPSPTPTPTPVPTEISPTPTVTASPIPTPTPPSQTPTPTPLPTPFIYPGEVTQYQNQSLSLISDVYQNAIAGTQYLTPPYPYLLTVTGLVNNTLEYTYDDVVNNHTAYQKVVTLSCVEGWSATILWQGVLVNDLLKEAGVSPNATVVIFHSADNYTTALPLDYIVQNNIMIAYKMNNVTLTPQIGWPFMVVAQDQYGYKWAKWLTEIEVSNDTNYLGFWESNGYPNNATLLSDPNNATLHSDNVSVAEVIVVSVAGTVIATVIYTTLVKTNTKKPKFWRRQRSG